MHLTWGRSATFLSAANIVTTSNEDFENVAKFKYLETACTIYFTKVYISVYTTKNVKIKMYKTIIVCCSVWV